MFLSKKNKEKDWIEGCLKGHRQAQRSVYEFYASRMLAVCRRYIRQEMEAEEVMTNGFLKVFSKITQFKGEGSFGGWVRRIMVNECLNHLRGQRMMYAEIDIEKVSDTMNYSVYEQTFSTEDLYRFIDLMPVGYKTVFNLYAIEGYSHKEIGDILGINENTSKSQLSRARLFLQNKIQEYEKQLNNIQYGS